MNGKFANASRTNTCLRLKKTLIANNIISFEKELAGGKNSQIFVGVKAKTSKNHSWSKHGIDELQGTLSRQACLSQVLKRLSQYCSISNAIRKNTRNGVAGGHR